VAASFGRPGFCGPAPLVWEQVQTVLKKNGSNGGRNVRNRYGALLKGILRCTPCDAAMTHSFIKKNGRRYRYYVCGKAQRTGWASCPTKSLPAEEIEQLIYERIRAIGSDPAIVGETIRAAQKQLEDQTARLKADTRILKQRLNRCQKEKQKLLESISKGGIIAAKAAERLDQVAEETESANSRLSDLRRQRSVLQKQKFDTEDLTAAINQFDPIWNVLLPRERVRIVRLLIQQVDFDGETGTMGITFQPLGIKALAAEST
jgi:site-specific DNA recombinase